MRISRELVAASSRPLILSILAEGENYGYAILQEVSKRSAGQLEWTEGMLYPVLHRLEREGHVESRWRTRDGRKRKYYRINHTGSKAVLDEREQWSVVLAALGTFLEPRHV
jgi:DNA-binding PadR family transcriptional regulator